MHRRLRPRPARVWWLGIWLSICAPIVFADADRPVAVRRWGRDTVSIESHGNLHVVIDPRDEWLTAAHRPPVELALLTRPSGDLSNLRSIAAAIVAAVDAKGQVADIHHVLDRLPNADQVTWKAWTREVMPSDHGVIVQSIAGPSSGVMIFIRVDGVRILYAAACSATRLTERQTALAPVDVLVLSKSHPWDPWAVRQLRPRIIVPLSDPSNDRVDDDVANWIRDGHDEVDVTLAVGNTVAVRSVHDEDDPSCRIVHLQSNPWQMPPALAELFARKEAANVAAQEMFAPLRIDQMNYRPQNGTHTPRWNAEHMMGRELGFFSQVYGAIDPAVAWIDLNPAQMPPDYVARHADWTGAEEARQLARVSAFTRRFAYLLHDLEMDQRAPGSRWTPRGLLRQMERHYREHTANVVKKFELPGWPE